MSAIASMSTLALIAATALAQVEGPLGIDEAESVIVESAPSAVTLYRGRAAVTRSHAADLNPGVYNLRFAGLPEEIVPQSIQAHAEGPVKVVGVEFESQPADDATSPEIAKLDEQIEKVEVRLRDLAGQELLIQSEEQFIGAVSIRATTDASNKGGTDQLDLDAVKKQLGFVTQERTRLMQARQTLQNNREEAERELQRLRDRRNAIAGEGGLLRTAVVTLVAAESASARVDLTYLVAAASWEPSYNIRAAADGSSTQVEYDALLTQRTGEDWNDVVLTLSTARPTVAANPPALAPWYVDVVSDVPADQATASMSPAPGQSVDRESDAAKRLMGPGGVFGDPAADAEVGGGGPSVTFQLPRRVTVKSNSQAQQSTRIATVDTNPRFVHVAQPMVTEAVYLRGDLTNSSVYQFLPGRASIFIGQDFVGPTTVDSVSPGGQFKVFFGIDPAVKATRQLLSKKTENTGLLGGGRRTSYDYRVAVDNGSGKAITLELRDRIPVSRSDQIQVDLADVSEPLATDAYYVTEERPQGILKWWLTVPTSARAPTPYELTYGVRINRSKDIEMTPLPE